MTDAPLSLPQRLWLVIQPNGQQHFVSRESLEGIAEWAKGSDATVIEYGFVVTVYEPPAEPSERKSHMKNITEDTFPLEIQSLRIQSLRRAALYGGDNLTENAEQFWLLAIGALEQAERFAKLALYAERQARAGGNVHAVLHDASR
jgi:hypothetical protein